MSITWYWTVVASKSAWYIYNGCNLKFAPSPFFLDTVQQTKLMLQSVIPQATEIVSKLSDIQL